MSEVVSTATIFTPGDTAAVERRMRAFLRPASAEDRFWWHTATPTDGCWTWAGSVNSSGYGVFRDERQVYVHRWAHETFIGPIPQDAQVDHLCRNRLCVRPDHLEAVTPRENTLRSDGLAAANARKTHCPAGHAYDVANTYLVRRQRHCRACRACARLRWTEARGR